MILSRYNLKNISPEKAEIPDESLFELPEKVLQFGTGVLLRGLPDYFIDKANKQGLFNGRIVVVKSTDKGDSSAFEKQDGLYTLCIRGIEEGRKVEENIINGAVSRVLSAKTEWGEILQCAHNPHMQVIISNTTETGIQLVNDDIRRHPPLSFPGKLLSFLYERYNAFAGSRQSGMVIIPTELITDNGRKLESIVMELAHLNGLEDGFIQWLETANRFCNSLVDRIVPGKPDTTVKDKIEKELGYTDELLIMAEAYSLWAIEGDDEIKTILSFAAADNGVVIEKDITLFRELKLRMLNGTHTLSCGLAHLAGFETVRQAMEDDNMCRYIADLMLNEIAPAIPWHVKKETAEEFGKKVLDRFRNPYINHQWLSISMQYTSKMKMRNVPVILKYGELFNAVPENIALGFAAYLSFMRPLQKQQDRYYGEQAGKTYLLQDDYAGYFYEKWSTFKPAALAAEVLSDISLWGEDLSAIPGFTESVAGKMNMISEEGVVHTLQRRLSQKAVI